LFEHSRQVRASAGAVIGELRTKGRVESQPSGPVRAVAHGRTVRTAFAAVRRMAMWPLDSG